MSKLLLWGHKAVWVHHQLWQVQLQVYQLVLIGLSISLDEKLQQQQPYIAAQL